MEQRRFNQRTSSKYGCRIRWYARLFRVQIPGQPESLARLLATDCPLRSLFFAPRRTANGSVRAAEHVTSPAQWGSDLSSDSAESSSRHTRCVDVPARRTGSVWLSLPRHDRMRATLGSGKKFAQ